MLVRTLSRQSHIAYSRSKNSNFKPDLTVKLIICFFFSVTKVDQLKEYAQMGRCVSLVNKKERRPARRGRYVVTIEDND
jgi:hypothetical protein